MWTGHSKHLVLVEKHVGVGADGTGYQGEAGTRGGDPSIRKSEAELCQFLKGLNQSPGKSYLYSARQPAPHQAQTLCGRGLEICSLNQCEVGTTREGSSTPGVCFTCVCVSDSCSVCSTAHSWRPLLNLAFGDSSLFEVSWGLFVD